jgi:phosphoribosylformimino-5-aminoimidazole carboxamide ribotide isomerase
LSGLILYPAVDILAGKAVRLTQGSFDQSTVYDEDPLAAASRWVEEGAEALHVVDLEGARTGEPANLDLLRKISELPVRIQYGGGLRSFDSIAAALSAGADRVVLGTVAFSAPEVLEDAMDRFGDRVAVGIDVREGRVAMSGWVEQSEVSGPAAVEGLRSRGVRRFVYTNIDRDGTLRGIDPNDVDNVSDAVGKDASFVYSGGVGSIADLIDVAYAHSGNLEGVIVGKALYEHRFRLQDAKRALENPEEAAERP